MGSKCRFNVDLVGVYYDNQSTSPAEPRKSSWHSSEKHRGITYWLNVKDENEQVLELLYEEGFIS